MRILYVLEHYFPYIGGAEKLFQELAEGMAAQGHHVVVITTLFNRELPMTETVNKVKVVRLNCYNRFLFTFFAFFKLITLKDRFDLVHSTTYNAAVPAWLYARLKGYHCILTFHEVWDKLWFELPFLSYGQRLVYFWYEKFVTKLKFDQYIAVSQATQESLIEAGIEKKSITCIHNGLDQSLYADKHVGSSEGKFKFLYFGRLGVSKGLELIIPAFTQLKKERTDVELDLVLPTTPTSVFQQVLGMIHQNGDPKDLNIFHEVSSEELQKMITTSDAILIPSHSEGFCFAAAEACALGAPVIHSGRKALAEVVSGMNIEMSSVSVSGLLDAMKKARAGEWNLTSPKQFLLSETIRHHFDLYNRSITS